MSIDNSSAYERAQISARNPAGYPIDTTTFDHAVKASLTDGKAPEWSEQEKAAFKGRTGAGGQEIFPAKETVVEDSVNPVTGALDHFINVSKSSSGAVVLDMHDANRNGTINAVASLEGATIFIPGTHDVDVCFGITVAIRNSQNAETTYQLTTDGLTMLGTRDSDFSNTKYSAKGITKEITAQSNCNFVMDGNVIGYYFGQTGFYSPDGELLSYQAMAQGNQFCVCMFLKPGRQNPCGVLVSANGSATFYSNTGAIRL